MKFWDIILSKDLSFEEASSQIKKFKPYYMTRPGWDGVHFYNEQGEYCILFRDGHIETNMLEQAWDKDKHDWMIVTITEEAVRLIQEHQHV